LCSPRGEAEQQAERAVGARGVADPQGSHGRAFHICHGRAFAKVPRQRGQRFREQALSGVHQIRAADVARGRGRGDDRYAQFLQEGTPRGIATYRAPKTSKKSDDQVVPGGCQAGTAANQAIERARGLVNLQIPGRAGEAHSLVIDDPADQFDLGDVGARSSVSQRVPCRPPRLSHARVCKINASGREFATPSLRRAEVDRQLAAGDPEHVGATSDPLSDRDLA
jgi:hypothetical protein